MFAKTFHVTTALLAGALSLTAAAAAAPTTVRVKTIAIDPAISRLSNEELIDRLQEEAQRKVDDSHPMALRDSERNWGASHLEQPALQWVFLPVAAPARFEENLSPVPRSPVMAELVSRGVESLPALLQHLSDDRPTRLSVPVGFSFQLNYRFAADLGPPNSDQAWQPKIFNAPEPIRMNWVTPDSSSTIKVGDLCYQAIGQIVNRVLGPTVGRPGHFGQDGFVISSPVLDPTLAAAVRADWDGLTAKKHEQNLREDALRTDPRGMSDSHSWGAIRRLLFYYPDAGREVVQSLLRRGLTDGETTSQAIAANQVSYHEQAELVAELNPIQWNGLEDTLFSVYQAAVQQRPGTVSARYYRNELAYVCAKRIAGQGHDREIANFFAGQIEAQAAARREATNNPFRSSLADANERYRALLRKLAAGEAHAAPDRKG